MELRVVCLMTVWACAFLTTCVMAAPTQSDSTEDMDTWDETMLLQTIIDWASQNMILGDISSDEDDDDTFTRRRRILAGIHSKHPGSRRRFRGRRPRIFVPRGRPGSRGRSRNNVSPY